jgi:hypothetical protein
VLNDVKRAALRYCWLHHNPITSVAIITYSSAGLAVSNRVFLDAARGVFVQSNLYACLLSNFLPNLLT